MNFSLKYSALADSNTVLHKHYIFPAFYLAHSERSPETNLMAPVTEQLC